jgi:methylated-DNA-[protein]-cysteine S-methyltransferase
LELAFRIPRASLWQTIEMFQWSRVEVSPNLKLRLVASVSGIRAVEFRPQPSAESERNDGNPLLSEAARQLRAYFSGDLRAFDLPLDLQGTPFQLRVWRALLTIPYGATRSYSQIALAIGAPQAVRAVGAANGANPIAIVVPCHRVIGSGGSLTGYGGGLPLKRKLLELEGAVTPCLPG